MADWRPIAQIAELASGGPPSMPSYAPNPMSSYAPNGMQSFGPKIPNYLWQSIAVTCLCCVPFGVVAIVYATKVDGMVAKGDIAGATAASKAARLWVNLSAGSFLVIIVIGLLAGLVSEM